METNKVNEANDLVDLAFDEGFEVFGKAVKAKRKAEKILDAIEEAGAIGRAAQGIGRMAKGAGKEIGVGIAVGGALAGAGALAKRQSAKSVCSKYPKGSEKFRACMHKLIHGTREGDEVDLGQGSSYQARPYDHPKKVRVAADVEECDMSGDGPLNKGISGGDVEMDTNDYGWDGEYDQAPSSEIPGKKANVINHVPNQKPHALYQSLRRQMSEYKNMNEDDKAAYRNYFAGMLKKFGASSPADLDGDKKKEFFNAVDKGWKAKNEGWVNQIIKNT